MTPRGRRLTEGSVTDALLHWSKSRRFREAARHDYDGAHWDAAFSNAILAAIRAADALSLRFLGVRSSSQDHDETVDLVETIRELPEAPRKDFVRHVRSLLEAKGVVQYSNRAYAPEDADLALKHLDRALEAIAAIARQAGWT